MTTVAEAPFRASRYTTGAIVLHWSIAILIMLQLLSGFAMVRVMEQGTNIQFTVYQLHKSAGFAVLILTVARIMWRVFNPPPAEPASVTALESRASHFVHMAFYALMILIPLSGWLMITVSPVQLETVLFFASWLPWPHLPGLGWMAADARADLTHATEIVHLVLAYLMAFLMVLHVAGALKHHFEDGVFLKRMSLVIQGDGPRNSYGHATTWLVTVTFFAAMVGAATYARTVGEEPSVEMATISPDQSAILGSADAIPPEQGVLANENSAAAVASAPAAQPAHSWIVDPEASSLTFSFIYSGATVEGVFARFEPTIVFDPNDLANASIDVVIDTSSASVDSSEISRGNLMGADGFNTSNFATARFTADTIRAEGDGYVADGTLSIKGEEVPQSLPFTLQIEGDRATAEGTLTIDRFNYAIGKNSDATGDWLSAEVAVNVAITANRAPSGGAQSAAAEDAPAAVAAPLWTVVTADSTVALSATRRRCAAVE
ncbi:MAG: cytochrome b/b6 domain-containing protein, partial [Pseudomonadota bacterium]